MSKNLVVKDNALINASYNLDLIEQRLILMAIVQARKSKQSITKQDKVVINVAEYAKEFGVILSGSLYQNIKNACDVIFERQFSYKEFIDDDVKYTKSRWVSKVSYIPDRAVVELYFTDDVLQFITALERHFTSYELEQVSGLNSKYSVRLYELLIAWREKGVTPIISIEDIRNRLGVAENEYKLMGDFKKRVIEPSVKEVSLKTDIQVSYEQHKEGRKIVGFTFSFKVRKRKSDKKENQNKRDNKTIDMLAPIKMTDKQRSLFASKLSHTHECSQLPYGNESYEALAKWIEKDLLKPERAEFYRPLLEKLGFKGE